MVGIIELIAKIQGKIDFLTLCKQRLIERKDQVFAELPGEGTLHNVFDNLEELAEINTKIKETSKQIDFLESVKTALNKCGTAL